LLNIAAEGIQNIEFHSHVFSLPVKEPAVTVTESLPSDTDTGEEGSVGVSVVISNNSPGALSDADSACPVHLRLPSGQLQKKAR